MISNKSQLFLFLHVNSKINVVAKPFNNDSDVNIKCDVINIKKVSEKLGTQTQITQAFDQERRKIKTQLNEDEKSYRDAAKEALENGDRDYWEAYSQEADKIQQKSLLFDGISGAIYGPNTNGAVGYVAKAISPQVAFQIGQAFKDNDFNNSINEDNELAGVGSPQHLLAHLLLGAAVSYATGNDVLIGGTSAAVGEGQALLLSKYLYDTKDPSELTAEQKDTISSIASLTGVALGATTGDVTDAVNAGETALVAVQDNGLENVLLPHEIDEIKNNPNYSREQLEAFQRMPEMIGDLDIVYKKNNKGNFIVCVPYSGNSCAPRSNERYATPDEIRQGAQDFALDVVPIPGSKGAAIVVKKTGQVIGKYKDARAAKKAADEAVQKARVTNNNQIDDDLGNKPLGGEHRANQYSYKWQGASLRNVREKFAGENPIITQTSKGKIIHENRETGIQVVYDKGGDYFRIYDKSLKGRKYLDLNGKVLNNKTLPNGKKTGMSKSEYNEATHFKVDR